MRACRILSRTRAGTYPRSVTQARLEKGSKEVILSPFEIESDRVVCIMGYAEWVDFERFERKRFSGLENFPVRTPWQLGLDRLNGVPVSKNRQPAEL